ncbi:MAG: hypothetical protein H5T97_05680 [Firmicutes bacterium]|nr:hypothetical protein [Bacillota bacterium]
MSQFVLCHDAGGALLASDGRITRLGPAGEEVAAFSGPKIFPLGSHAVISSAGPAAGLVLCRRLSEMAPACGVPEFTRLYRLAVAYLTDGYYRFVSAHRARLLALPEEYRFVCFLLAGYAPEHRAVRVHLLESRNLELPFTEPAVGPVLTLPRVLSLEAALVRRWRDPRRDPAALAEFVCGRLARLARDNPRLGPPYLCALVGPEGRRLFTRHS